MTVHEDKNTHNAKNVMDAFFPTEGPPTFGNTGEAADKTAKKAHDTVLKDQSGGKTSKAHK